MSLTDNNGLTLQQFLEKYKAKNYPKPYLTADCLILSEKDNKLYILLIKRKNHPFIQQWAIPGGFAQENEELSQTAKRELQEETSLSANVSLLNIYSAANRDPRGWVVSATYYGFVDKDKVCIHSENDAADAKWFEIQIIDNKIYLINNMERIEEEKLAFDHNIMIRDFLKKYHIL